MKDMKKLIIAASVVAVAIVGVVIVKNRFGLSFSMKVVSSNGQIALTNDSPDKISVEYKSEGKKTDSVIAPGERLVCGEDGFVRVFTSKKSGSYEVMYPAEGSLREVTVSQIAAAAQKKELEEQVSVAKGMIGDIKVMYEEPRELD
jgi:hypothetical protein